MRPFAYERAGDATAADYPTAQGQVDAPAQYLAGGTTLLDLMKLDVLTPGRVIDINDLRARHGRIEADGRGLRLGAFVTMAEAADHPVINRDYPAIAQSLQLAASPQLRNMATLGGNVLQRTRCPYYRDTSWAACNKRVPGSGCSALGGFNRNHAVLGVSERCISQYPGDFAVALAALDATVELTSRQGARTIPILELHQGSDRPEVETTLRSGEVITGFHLPGGPLPRRSMYLKIRDRQSYEFAISSAAVALEMGGGVVRQARIGLGGMAYKPWRATAAEAFLVGKPLTEDHALEAGRVALQGAVGHGHNDYKRELGPRTVARALMELNTQGAHA